MLHTEGTRGRHHHTGVRWHADSSEGSNARETKTVRGMTFPWGEEVGRRGAGSKLPCIVFCGDACFSVRCDRSAREASARRAALASEPAHRIDGPSPLELDAARKVSTMCAARDSTSLLAHSELTQPSYHIASKHCPGHPCCCIVPITDSYWCTGVFNRRAGGGGRRARPGGHRRPGLGCGQRRRGSPSTWLPASHPNGQQWPFLSGYS